MGLVLPKDGAKTPGMTKTVKIGTRGSKLALVQADMVAQALKALGVTAEIVRIETSGDWKPAQGETRLSEVQGGKGQFAKEIEAALLRGEIDCGVHSMKDMPSFLPGGLIIRHILKREDARDAFLANGVKTIDELPHGAVVGTSSLRRQAFVLARRPDLKIVPIRGNVPTRIEKLRAGQVDATLLAMAGLKRLGLDHEISAVLEPADMLPAAGQGAVGIEIRAEDTALAEILDRLHCRESGLRVAAERAALQVLDGSCHTPIGAYAVLDGRQLMLQVDVASGDGRQFFKTEKIAKVATDAEAAALGREAGEDLKARVPVELLQ
jgi:hydroxymethylbilane synthase